MSEAVLPWFMLPRCSGSLRVHNRAKIFLETFAGEVWLGMMIVNQATIQNWKKTWCWRPSDSDDMFATLDLKHTAPETKGMYA